MDIYQELSLEQQFELKVFEESVRQLPLHDAQALLIELRGSMMHQATAFREILKDSWGIGKEIEITQDRFEN
ncbi:MAG: Phycobilisome degradation protein nblA [Phormidesmis priestleyi Ana]|uniref:Phycobilisome degradation protein nblA n=1 Tax=Phormidesmis priestleyi Ana TaxID=1666911 RepID=A0A0P8DFA6_9CYAN|nr:MAG: Phycobilisome degradation protein nblA [Phormidesmis priestleyi Ana]